MPFQKSEENKDPLLLIDKLRMLKIEGYNNKQEQIVDIVSGMNHNILKIKNTQTDQFRLVVFGHEMGIPQNENGIGAKVNQKNHQYIPVEIKLPKKLESVKSIDIIYSRYNTSLIIDKKHQMFIWGEDANGLRQKKIKLLHKFQKTIVQVALGKRHGVVLDSKHQVFGWGDGTYGELGSSVKSKLPLEKPTLLNLFSSTE